MATNNSIDNTFDKTYDDCNPQVGLFCIAAKILPVTLYAISNTDIYY